MPWHNQTGLSCCCNTTGCLVPVLCEGVLPFYSPDLSIALSSCLWQLPGSRKRVFETHLYLQDSLPGSREISEKQQHQDLGFEELSLAWYLPRVRDSCNSLPGVSMGNQSQEDQSSSPSAFYSLLTISDAMTHRPQFARKYWGRMEKMDRVHRG